MQTASKPSAINFREEGLLCALRSQQGERAADVLRRHPNAATLLPRLESKANVALAKLFSDELEKLEAQLPFRYTTNLLDPTYRYWARRRFLVRWREIAATLPAYWGKLVTLSRAQLEKTCAGIGLGMVGHAMLLESPERVIRWLEVLGANLARHVVDQFDRLRKHPVPKELAERWHFGFGRVRNRYKGQKIAQVLGCSLLSVMYRRLPNADRAALESWHRASLEPTVDRTISEELCPGGQLETIGEFLTEIVDSAMPDFLAENGP